MWSKFFNRMKGSTDRRFVQIFKAESWYPRTYDLAQIFEGESRDPRTAKSLRFLKRGYVSYDLTVLTSNRTEPNQLRTGGTIIHV